MLRFVFIAIAFLAAPARGEESCPTPDLSSLVTELAGWIARHSDLQTNRLLAVMPEIIFCAPQAHVAYGGGELIVEENTLAAYDLTARRIYLVEPWSVEDPRAVSVLLHELVHAVQFDSRAWDCPQQTEWQAYRLQADWLAGQGIEPGFDWTAIGLQSLCRPDAHP